MKQETAVLQMKKTYWERDQRIYFRPTNSLAVLRKNKTSYRYRHKA